MNLWSFEAAALPAETVGDLPARAAAIDNNVKLRRDGGTGPLPSSGNRQPLPQSAMETDQPGQPEPAFQPSPISLF